MPDDTLKRLHITPLSPALLESILNPSVRMLATDVSFHSIQTFPENNYGYITLPSVEADKLSKKLNGSILKGKKFKIQEAMPKKRLAEESSVADDTGKRSKREKSSKKRKTNDETVPGFELPADRKVKRGWTEDPAEAKKSRKGDKSKSKKDDKKRRSQRSKYSEHQECLFRTVAPPNKKPVDEKEGKGKKSKLARDSVVVHEFSKTTTHPTFLRTNDSGSKDDMTSEYVEDKGWVDRAGKVKEPPVPKKEKKRVKVPPAVPEKTKSKEQKTHTSAAVSKDEVDSDWTSSSGSSLDSSSDGGGTSESDEEDVPALKAPGPPGVSKATPGSSPEKPSPAPESSRVESYSEGAPSESSSESEDDDSATSDLEDDKVDRQGEHGRQGSEEQQSIQTDLDGDNDKGPSTPKASEPKADAEVHPLDALFKLRQQPTTHVLKPASEGKGQFSFFGNNDDIDEDEDFDDGPSNHIVQHSAEPQTPFTKQDMKSRLMRSGAPTPDTAAVNRRKCFDDKDEDNEDEDEMDFSPQPTSGGKKQAAVEESDFAKWFWENRGDNNRAWKRRRREAAKEKRQKDNRRRGLRGK